MFSNFFLRSFRILLLPFALLYWLIIGIRNLLYDWNILKSTSFGLPLICVGNLSVGGTGKSPMVEWLVTHLKDQFRVGLLSRGYKRKTKGYALANSGSNALDIGDEPMQFTKKFPDVPVAVGEERMDAIPQLLHDRPETQVIILDDAFQHRAVKAGLNILLTEQGNLYTHDFYLPTGDLRDLKRCSRRAEIIVVTKCRPDLSREERETIIRDLGPLPEQKVFFTAIDYGKLYHISNRHPFSLDHETEVLLITGIANPRPLKKMVEENSQGYQLLQYPDHHIFTIDEVKEIRRRFEDMSGEGRIILTTEKDAVRFEKFIPELQYLPFYVVPIRHNFLFGEGDQFLDSVTQFIRQFKKAV